MELRALARAATGAATLALLVLGVPARAFHEGGVGACDACHSMHGPADGATQGAYLLAGGDASSVCLNCHGDVVNRGYTVFTKNVFPGQAPLNFGPAGDFAWLKKGYVWMDRRGVTYVSPGERHGHSVVAQDYGLARDPTRTTAPGGLYPTDGLSCISCHDPHGGYRVRDNGTVVRSGVEVTSSGSHGQQPAPDTAVGSYRLLAGRGYAPRSVGAAPTFVNDPPVAVAPLTHNRSERITQNRVAYGVGMSEWCGNCHGALHTPTSPSTFMHPSGATALLARNRIATIYNTYVKTGDLSGTLFTSYLSLVPFEEGTTDLVTLSTHAGSDGTATMGPSTGTETVMCLSCHRAHASGWDQSMRWNQKSDAIVADGLWPGTDAGGAASDPTVAQGRTVAETRAAMYDRDPNAFATFQTSLCNKCHAK